MPATIRKGSKGPDVSKWQLIVGFTGPAVDGDFGPKTEEATKQYQRAHGLLPDGVVGKDTWGVALGTAPGAAPGGLLPGGSVADHMKQEGASAAPARSGGGDLVAYNVAKGSGLGLTEAEVQYAVTVARGEGGYGKAWAHPSAATIELSKKFGLTGFEGAGSNNWGAEQGSGDAGSFRHVDRHADGSPYVASYRKYSSPEKGFAGFARILFSGNKRKAEGAAALKSAIARGSLRDAVFAQHANGYFELAPEKYLQAVLRNYAALTASTGWRAELTERGGRPGGGGGSSGGGVAAAVLGIGGAAVVAWMLLGRKA